MCVRLDTCITSSRDQLGIYIVDVGGRSLPCFVERRAAVEPAKTVLPDDQAEHVARSTRVCSTPRLVLRRDEHHVHKAVSSSMGKAISR